jgi:hypothetical protein
MNSTESENDTATKNAKPKWKEQLDAMKLKRPTGSVQMDLLNSKYCVVQDGSKVRVHSFEHHEHRGHVRLVSTFLHFVEFKNLMMNIKFKMKGKIVDLGSFWLNHPGRRQYQGIVFQPGSAGVIDGKLNLWRGFGVEPI